MHKHHSALLATTIWILNAYSKTVLNLDRHNFFMTILVWETFQLKIDIEIYLLFLFLYT